MRLARWLPSPRWLLGLVAGLSLRAADAPLAATRVGERPIIVGAMLAGDEGASINGPTMIRVPDWVVQPLGRYYLYFAHHNGKYLRLAYADHPEGPWKIHAAGVLRLADQKVVAGHIASPEAVIDAANHRILLFYHGGNPEKRAPRVGDPDGEAGQISGVAVSEDGLTFRPIGGVVGPAYLRVFHHEGTWFALNHSGMLRRAAAPGEPFRDVARIIGPEIIAAVDPALRGEPGATPADQRPPSGPYRYSIRHVGLDYQRDRLVVYFTCVGHRPERVLATVVPLVGAPDTWRARGTFEVLRPGTAAEGADLPLGYSNGGISLTPVNQLRDPAVFREGAQAWLLYSIAGEHGLGLARLTDQSSP